MSPQGQSLPKRAPQQRCPICSKPVPPDHPSYPFCSERCRKIDLGRWAEEKYRTTRSIEQSDLDEE